MQLRYQIQPTLGNRPILDEQTGTCTFNLDQKIDALRILLCPRNTNIETSSTLFNFFNRRPDGNLKHLDETQFRNLERELRAGAKLRDAFTAIGISHYNPMDYGLTPLSSAWFGNREFRAPHEVSIIREEVLYLNQLGHYSRALALGEYVRSVPCFIRAKPELESLLTQTRSLQRLESTVSDLENIRSFAGLISGILLERGIDIFIQRPVVKVMLNLALFPIPSLLFKGHWSFENYRTEFLHSLPTAFLFPISSKFWTFLGQSFLKSRFANLISNNIFDALLFSGQYLSTVGLNLGLNLLSTPVQERGNLREEFAIAILQDFQARLAHGVANPIRKRIGTHTIVSAEIEKSSSSQINLHNGICKIQVPLGEDHVQLRLKTEAGHELTYSFFENCNGHFEIDPKHLTTHVPIDLKKIRISVEPMSENFEATHYHYGEGLYLWREKRPLLQNFETKNTLCFWAESIRLNHTPNSNPVLYLRSRRKSKNGNYLEFSVTLNPQHLPNIFESKGVISRSLWVVCKARERPAPPIERKHSFLELDASRGEFKIGETILGIARGEMPGIPLWKLETLTEAAGSDLIKLYFKRLNSKQFREIVFRKHPDLENNLEILANYIGQDFMIIN